MQCTMPASNIQYVFGKKETTQFKTVKESLAQI